MAATIDGEGCPRIVSLPNTCAAFAIESTITPPAHVAGVDAAQGDEVGRPVTLEGREPCRANHLPVRPKPV
jgi:hypothetical protein